MLRKSKDEIEYDLILAMSSNDRLSPHQILQRAKEIAYLVDRKSEKYPALDIEGLSKGLKK